MPSPSPQHRVDIQGLRAIAVLLVIIDHARFGLSGGFIGVDVFFVISGFVITGMLLREVEGHGRIRLGRFFIRRGYRLIPGAAVVLTFTAILGALLLSPLGTQQQAAVTGGAAAVGLSNIALYGIASDYFSEHVQANPFLHTWSLGVEEQFYLFFPLTLLIVWKLAKHRSRATVTVLSVIAAVSLGLALVMSFSAVLPIIKNPPIFAFYMMPTRAWEFAAGALVACGVTVLARWRGHSIAAWIGLVMIFGSAVFINSSMPFPGIVALIPVLGAALVIFGGLRPNAASTALSWKPLAHLGDLSYSLYLWHWPLMVFARRLWPDSPAGIVGAIILTYVAAYLTFRYVETPFRGRASAWNWKSVRMPAVAVTVALVASGAMFVGAQINWANKNVATASDQLLERPIGYNECLSTIPVSKRDLSECTWPGSGAPIYLVGDSNAQQYTEALIGASEELDRPLTVATWGGCPFFDVGRIELNDPSKGAECSTYAADGMEWISAQEPGTVVIATASEMIPSDLTHLTAADGTVLTDPDAKAERWTEAMIARITELEALGNDVVIVDTIPHFEGSTRDWWHPVECQNAALFGNPEDCSVRVSTDDIDARMGDINGAEDAAITATGARAIDLRAEICADGWCDTYRDGTWIYRDGLHISPTFSTALTPLFTAALRG